MSEETGHKLVRLILITLVVLLLGVVYVFYQSYEGRQSLVESQRAACERGKLDRKANAQGWRIAESARKADGQFLVAAKYSSIARGLEVRSEVHCDKAFPKASLIP